MPADKKSKKNVIRKRDRFCRRRKVSQKSTAAFSPHPFPSRKSLLGETRSFRRAGKKPRKTNGAAQSLQLGFSLRLGALVHSQTLRPPSDVC